MNWLDSSVTELKRKFNMFSETEASWSISMLNSQLKMPNFVKKIIDQMILITYFLMNRSHDNSDALVQDQLLIRIPVPKKQIMWKSMATTLGLLPREQVLLEVL